MATICCSPPRQGSGRLLEPFLDAREERKDPFHIGFDIDRIRPREGAHLQVLEHRHAREQATRLGHRRDAALDALGGWQVVDFRAAIDDKGRSWASRCRGWSSS
jgi:hypothetical protein